MEAAILVALPITGRKRNGPSGQGESGARQRNGTLHLGCSMCRPETSHPGLEQHPQRQSRNDQRDQDFQQREASDTRMEERRAQRTRLVAP
jgi:hypothetical protein